MKAMVACGAGFIGSHLITHNMEQIRVFYQDAGIILNGRFGNFEYWNMDRILRESFELSKRITSGQ